MQDQFTLTSIPDITHELLDLGLEKTLKHHQQQLEFFKKDVQATPESDRQENYARYANQFHIVNLLLVIKGEKLVLQPLTFDQYYGLNTTEA